MYELLPVFCSPGKLDFKPHDALQLTMTHVFFTSHHRDNTFNSLFVRILPVGDFEVTNDFGPWLHAFTQLYGIFSTTEDNK